MLTINEELGLLGDKVLGAFCSPLPAISGYPHITVPAPVLYIIYLLGYRFFLAPISGG